MRVRECEAVGAWVRVSEEIHACEGRVSEPESLVLTFPQILILEWIVVSISLWILVHKMHLVVLVEQPRLRGIVPFELSQSHDRLTRFPAIDTTLFSWLDVVLETPAILVVVIIIVIVTVIIVCCDNLCQQLLDPIRKQGVGLLGKKFEFQSKKSAASVSGFGRVCQPE